MGQTISQIILSPFTFTSKSNGYPPMAEPPPQQEPISFMTLPREVRDEIYMYLLPSRYCVDTSGTYRYDSNDRNSNKEYYQASPLFAFEIPAPRFGIIATNKQVSEEAKEVLYKYSTFVFNIGSQIESPNPTFGHIKALRSMQNIAVKVDLHAAASYAIKDYHQEAMIEAAMDSAVELLNRFSEEDSNHHSCYVKIIFQGAFFMTLPIDFVIALGELQGFDRVGLKLETQSDPSWTTWTGLGSSTVGNLPQPPGNGLVTLQVPPAQLPQARQALVWEMTVKKIIAERYEVLDLYLKKRIGIGARYTNNLNTYVQFWRPKIFLEAGATEVYAEMMENLRGLVEEIHGSEPEDETWPDWF